MGAVVEVIGTEVTGVADTIVEVMGTEVMGVEVTGEVVMGVEVTGATGSVVGGRFGGTRLSHWIRVGRISTFIIR